MRPWKIWLLFAFCASVLLAVMGWVSGMALRLDRAQARMRAEAQVEEKVRLALWRMDSMLSPVIAQESARPYFAYSAFHPAERAYGKMYNPLDPGEVLMPSPLLTQVSSNVLLHFQFDPAGRLTSPQVPLGNHRDLAEARYTTHEQIEAMAARLEAFRRILGEKASPELVRLVERDSEAGTGAVQRQEGSVTGEARGNWGGGVLTDNSSVLLRVAPAPQGGANVLAANTAPIVNSALQQQLEVPQKRAVQTPDFEERQKARSAEELQARAQSVQQAFDINVKNVFANQGAAGRVNVVEGLMKPVWFGNTLVLVRRVAVDGQEYVQGCWLDWPGVRQWLLDGVKDLLPAATIEPLSNGADDPQPRMLAALPVRVVPGLDPDAPGLPVSPIRVALILAWACALLAGLAVAFLLQGTVSLSERRGAFVSAVTHELRTPLTTFKMYSEMLAGGMVADESKRQRLPFDAVRGGQPAESSGRERPRLRPPRARQRAAQHRDGDARTIDRARETTPGAARAAGRRGIAGGRRPGGARHGRAGRCQCCRTDPFQPRRQRLQIRNVTGRRANHPPRGAAREREVRAAARAGSRTGHLRGRSQAIVPSVQQVGG